MTYPAYLIRPVPGTGGCVVSPNDPRAPLLVTGASGFIGGHLLRNLLASGQPVLALRHQQALPLTHPLLQVCTHVDALPDDQTLSGIVNLAGASIAARPWTRSRRATLLLSRLTPTEALVRLVQRMRNPPPVLVSASAVGFYGLQGAEPVDETAASQDIFQSQLCAQWEQAALRAGVAGTRVVLLRLGVVLGRDGGALPALCRAARFGMASVLGDGRQGLPWIHIDDAVGLIRFALSQPAVSGALNAVAPQAVSQRQFQRALCTVLGRPCWLRIPAAPLRAILGEMAQLLVDGQFVEPRRTLASGFTFRQPALEPALRQLLTHAARIPA